MSEENKKVELNDDDLEKVTGGNGNCGGTEDYSGTCNFKLCQDVCLKCKHLEGGDVFGTGSSYSFVYACELDPYNTMNYFCSNTKYYTGVATITRKVESEVVPH